MGTAGAGPGGAATILQCISVQRYGGSTAAARTHVRAPWRARRPTHPMDQREGAPWWVGGKKEAAIRCSHWGARPRGPDQAGTHVPWRWGPRRRGNKLANPPARFKSAVLFHESRRYPAPSQLLGTVCCDPGTRMQSRKLNTSQAPKRVQSNHEGSTSAKRESVPKLTRDELGRAGCSQDLQR